MRSILCTSRRKSLQSSTNLCESLCELPEMRIVDFMKLFSIIIDSPLNRTRIEIDHLFLRYCVACGTYNTVDLKRFRQLAASDRLRGVYPQLSVDENSLATLDYVRVGRSQRSQRSQ